MVKNPAHVGYDEQGRRDARELVLRRVETDSRRHQVIARVTVEQPPTAIVNARVTVRPLNDPGEVKRMQLVSHEIVVDQVRRLTRRELADVQVRLAGFEEFSAPAAAIGDAIAALDD
jgi:hypothetical protein